MRNLDLNACGVSEMSTTKMTGTESGFFIVAVCSLRSASLILIYSALSLFAIHWACHLSKNCLPISILIWARMVHRFRNEGKTIIIIAHRLSTVIHADKIVVLENGKVIEEETHKELYGAKGRYHQMWEKQMPAKVV